MCLFLAVTQRLAYTGTLGGTYDKKYLTCRTSAALMQKGRYNACSYTEQLTFCQPSLHQCCRTYSTSHFSVISSN